MFKFETLDIWKDSALFTKKIYLLTKKFPRDELFALSDQIRRSATSVPANIAEGSGSSSKKDFSHYLDISIKSIYEVVSHLYIAREQKYIDEQVRKELYDEAETLVRKIKAFKVWLSHH
jgi:four helix bundle protein